MMAEMIGRFLSFPPLTIPFVLLVFFLLFPRQAFLLGGMGGCEA